MSDFPKSLLDCKRLLIDKRSALATATSAVERLDMVEPYRESRDYPLWLKLREEADELATDLNSEVLELESHVVTESRKQNHSTHA
ncbi:MAG: hypothetical protein V4690_04015 [Patescibacteria group bacterium]